MDNKNTNTAEKKIAPSLVAFIARSKICWDTCFNALPPEDPAKATSFRIGYTAWNLSVSCANIKFTTVCIILEKEKKIFFLEIGNKNKR